MARDLHRALSASALLALAACSGGTSSGDGGDDSPFIAFKDSFADFRSWRSTPGKGPDGSPQPPQTGIHDGALTSYINTPPPTGSTTFPKGTIIVKEPSTGPVLGRVGFAMVKQGAGFNSAGAVDWCWYEITTDDTGVRIVWRGAGPPSGEQYGSTPTICNDCHAGARSNDYVWTTGFTLSGF